MKLAVSNIGWSAALDNSIAPRLRDAGAEAIEVAPGRLFDDPAGADLGDARAIAQGWAGAGLPIVSMQALLFGQGDLALLGDTVDQDRLVDYLDRIIALAGALGCGPLVFGSPKNRLRGDMDFETAKTTALPALRRIGDAAKSKGCTFCLEANATGYGCDFMTVLDEAADVVRAADHPGVGLILDTGNMLMEEELASAVDAVADLVRHVHLSAPQLAPILAHANFIDDVLGRLRDRGYTGSVTIEMRPTPEAEPDPADALLRCTAAMRGLIDRA